MTTLNSGPETIPPDLTERYIAAKSELDAIKMEIEEVTYVDTTPSHYVRRWGMAKLMAAMRHLRDAEDFYRVNLPAYPTADRIRFIHEQITEDVLRGTTLRPALSETLGSTFPVHDAPKDFFA